MTKPAGAPITALLPLKNYEPHFLAEALESMFTQTVPEWRLLAVVEPEDRARFAVVLADALEDRRVRLVTNEGRKLSGAFNTGMRAADTDFVGILFADDRWAPQAVETLQANIALYPNADFFHSGRRIIDGEGRPLSSVHEPPDSVSADDFVWTGTVKHLLCWRREKALSFGGMDESLNSVGPDDYDFPWTMLEHGAVFQAIHECLYIYRDHLDGYRLTTHLPRSIHLRELRRILRKHGVDERLIKQRLRQSRAGYLKGCLYRNELHRQIMTMLNIEPRKAWRQQYR